MENYKKTKKALNEVSLVDLSLIDKSTFNPRKKFDEAMCRPDDDRLIYMVKQALENNSIDIYRGLQNPIITFSIQAIDNK